MLTFLEIILLAGFVLWCLIFVYGTFTYKECKFPKKMSIVQAGHNLRDNTKEFIKATLCVGCRLRSLIFG